MSLTVSNQASYYYNVYAYQKTDAFSESKGSEAAVLKDSYSISNIASAFDAADKTVSTDFYAIGNVMTCAKNNIKLSQSELYLSLLDSSENAISDILTNNTNMSGIYSRLIALSTVNSDYLKYYSSDDEKNDKDEKSAIDKYSSYLNEEKEESILDIIV